MNHIYLPSRGAHEWQWLLASPALHWKHSRSAMALADAWEGADGWPPAVQDALSTSPVFARSKLLLAIPEHKVKLPGGRAASQTDLFVLARAADGQNAAIAVEGKAGEPFGDQTVAGWRSDGSDGKVERLEFLLDLLRLADDENTAAVRYQLLHRTASAVLEAQQFNTRHALMLVHSFKPDPESLAEYQRFVALFGASASPGAIVTAGEVGTIELHFGWVDDSPLPAAEAQRLGPRFDRAVAFARDLHSTQFRKGTEIPYMAHLMGVTALVLEDGGDENEAIAALLHDAVEDQGGAGTLHKIRQLFGSRVADIVAACSDTDVIPKPPWRERKEQYLRHLKAPDLPAGALRVSLADKLHNARAILFDLRAGHDVFARFNAGREDQRWYYDNLATTFSTLSESPMALELRRVVDEIFVGI